MEEGERDMKKKSEGKLDVSSTHSPHIVRMAQLEVEVGVEWSRFERRKKIHPGPRLPPVQK